MSLWFNIQYHVSKLTIVGASFQFYHFVPYTLRKVLKTISYQRSTLHSVTLWSQLGVGNISILSRNSILFTDINVQK